MSLDKSEKGIHKVGGFSFITAGFFLFLFFIALMFLQTSPTLTAEMVLDDPVPTAFGVFRGRLAGHLTIPEI